LAVFSIFSYLFEFAPEPLVPTCIINRFSHVFLALLVKYVIYALGFNPNTIGELINGTSLTVFKNPSNVLLTG
jgi:hypothetical protein